MVLNFDPLPYLSREFSWPPEALRQTLELLNEGATIPFLARYRKDRTGGQDEVELQKFAQRLDYWREFDARRATIRQSLSDQGLLSSSLLETLEQISDKTALEDFYLPYKPKRRTRAQIAREQGFEPLANAILTQKGELASLCPASADEQSQALSGARDIVAEMLSERSLIREKARRLLWQQGCIQARLAKGVSDPGKYADYAEFEERLARIPSHRYLALRRGEQDKVLRLKITLPENLILPTLAQGLQIRAGIWGEQLHLALQDCWQRLLGPSLENELHAQLKERADQTAIGVFASNLREILMAAPFGGKSVVALDPGLRTGVKMVALSTTGQILDHTVLFILQKSKQAETLFLDYLDRFQPQGIALGDGTGSRETEQLLRQWLKSRPSPPQLIRVSEAGASIYSASEQARSEFPDLDLTVRGAISIGRRLQDPLAELVKIEPKSLGVGQYQHDVDQKSLSLSLSQVVESCVNQVGVELNTASVALLTHVAGFNTRLAKAVVEHREQCGAFRSRQELHRVKGLGPKAFEQAAGFLRIHDAPYALDRTGIHPEHYAVLEKICKTLGIKIEEALLQPDQLTQINPQTYAMGHYAWEDILAELRKPARDPREVFQMAQFREDIQHIGDLQPDMILEGRVTNITAFGAFVDVGVHQDGLVHISQLAEHYVRDPHLVVKVGQIIRVKVLEVDVARKRIQLSARCG